jgi:uncharacterized protein (DUF1330 family)
MQNSPDQPSSPMAAAILLAPTQSKSMNKGLPSARSVVTEFDSVEQAIAAHDSAAYQEAPKALGNACERDVRIVGGAD